MSLLVTLNGANYIIPEPGETGWGSNLDSFFVAIAAGCLQKTGGLFLLSVETDFGGSFGLKSLYYKSRSPNVSSTGILRLANNSDAVSWRNFANGADLSLLVNTSDQLQFNGHPIASSVTAKSFLYGDASGNIVATSNPTNGQLLIGSTGNIPAVSTLTGTSNQVIVTNSAGTITLSLPQDIGLSSNPSFLTLTANDSALPKLTISPSGVSTSTISEIHATDTGGAGFHIRDFGTGIVATINGRSAGGNAEIFGDRTLFIDAASGNVISFGINNVEVGYFNNTGLILPSALTVANGGTGDASLTAYAVLCGGTTSTNPVQSIAGVGSSGQVLTSNGAGLLPTFQNVAGTGTVNSGTQYQLAYYATSTNAVSGNSNITTNASNQLLVISGSMTTPGLSFTTDPDTGLFLSSAGNLDISIENDDRIRINSTTIISNNTFQAPNGSVSSPAITFQANTNAGLYRIGADNIALATNGIRSLEITSSQAVKAKGTSTNDSATAGDIGETVSSAVTNVNFPASTQWGDLTSISLTAGDWLVSIVGAFLVGTANTIDHLFGVSTTTGNSATGLAVGDTEVGNTTSTGAINSGNGFVSYSIPSAHFSLSTTTIIYLKFRSTYSSGTPQASGRISAVRIR